MKNLTLKLGILILFLLLSHLFAEEILATECKSGWVPVNPVYCGSTPSNQCCGCPSSCAGKPCWTYRYDPICCAYKEYGADYWEYQWYWSYTECAAVDRCCDGNGVNQRVCAGICDTNGCTTGGWYKSCCNGESPGVCDVICIELNSNNTRYPIIWNAPADQGCGDFTPARGVARR